MTTSPATSRKASRRTASHGIRPPGNSPRLQHPDRSRTAEADARTAIETLRKRVGEIPIALCSVALPKSVTASIGGEQAAKGINLPLADLLIGACALELGYAIGTSNVRDFNRIPGLNIVPL